MARNMPWPPLFDPSELDKRALEDIRDACALYHGSYGLTEAFDRLRTVPERCEYVAKIVAGEARGVEPVESLVEWLLRPWHSIRNFPKHARLRAGQALSKAQDILLRFPGDLTLEASQPEQITQMGMAYDTLAQCPYVGGTNASKMLAALRPEIFPMWDDDIAEAYGFCRRRGIGYRRFVTLAAEIARRLRELWTNKDKTLEDYIRPAGRAWKAPLAKLVDEWHWIRITQGVHG